MSSLAEDTRRFILNRGKSVSITATFQVAQGAILGSQALVMRDTQGLVPKTPFVVGTQAIVINTITDNSVSLETPLAAPVAGGTLLETSFNTKALFVAPGRDITRDSIEFSRRVRLPIDTLISCGSSVAFKNSRYYVTGYQEGDTSLSIGLKLINSFIDLYVPDPTDTETMLEPSEDITGWGTPVPTPADRTWPDSQGIVLKTPSIPAYQEQISLYSDLMEPGYVPTLNRMYLVPIWIPVETGHYIKVDDTFFRVIGIDPTRARNMQALYVNYTKGVVPDA